MVVCPVAIAVGCVKCPIVRICPAKTRLGNFRADDDATQPLPAAPKARGRSRPRR